MAASDDKVERSVGGSVLDAEDELLGLAGIQIGSNELQGVVGLTRHLARLGSGDGDPGGGVVEHHDESNHNRVRYCFAVIYGYDSELSCGGGARGGPFPLETERVQTRGGVGGTSESGKVSGKCEGACLAYLEAALCYSPVSEVASSDSELDSVARSNVDVLRASIEVDVSQVRGSHVLGRWDGQRGLVVHVLDVDDDVGAVRVNSSVINDVGDHNSSETSAGGSGTRDGRKSVDKRRGESTGARSTGRVHGGGRNAGQLSDEESSGLGSSDCISSDVRRYRISIRIGEISAGEHSVARDELILVHGDDDVVRDGRAVDLERSDGHFGLGVRATVSNSDQDVLSSRLASAGGRVDVHVGRGEGVRYTGHNCSSVDERERAVQGCGRNGEPELVSEILVRYEHREGEIRHRGGDGRRVVDDGGRVVEVDQIRDDITTNDLRGGRVVVGRQAGARGPTDGEVRVRNSSYGRNGGRGDALEPSSVRLGDDLERLGERSHESGTTLGRTGASTEWLSPGRGGIRRPVHGVGNGGSRTSDGGGVGTAGVRVGVSDDGVHTSVGLHDLESPRAAHSTSIHVHCAGGVKPDDVVRVRAPVEGAQTDVVHGIDQKSSASGRTRAGTAASAVEGVAVLRIQTVERKSEVVVSVEGAGGSVTVAGGLEVDDRESRVQAVRLEELRRHIPRVDDTSHGVGVSAVVLGGSDGEIGEDDHVDLRLGKVVANEIERTPDVGSAATRREEGGDSVGKRN